MSSTYGVDRQKIYKYVTENGFKFNEETHAVLKALLKDYVDHQNSALLEEAKAWRGHIPKCELFKAKHAAKAMRKKTSQSV